MTIGGWNPSAQTWSCASCAWLSPCRTKCFNPYYINMCKHNNLPISPEGYGCSRYENKDDRTKNASDIVAIHADSGIPS